MKLYIPVFLITAVITVFSMGCKKEYEQTPYNYTDILSFAYTDTAGQLKKATVKGDSIIVYWPDYMKTPVTVTAQIAVAENATVSPASGQRLQLVNGTAVTVTAQDGTKKIYYLKLIENMKPIMVTALVEAFRGDTGYNYINSNHNIKNIYEDATDTKLYAIRADGSELNINFSMRKAIAGTQIMTLLGFDLDTGRYNIKIVNAGRTTIAEKALNVMYAPPTFDRLTQEFTIKDGASIGFTGRFNQDYLKVAPQTLYLVNRSYDVVSPSPNWGRVLSLDTLGTLNYVSNTNTSVTYKAQLKKTGTFKYFDDVNYIILNPDLYNSPTELKGATLVNSNGQTLIQVHLDIPYRYVKLNLTQ